VIPVVSYQGGKVRIAKQTCDLMRLDRASAFYDLCAGSGAIGLEVMSRKPEWRVTFVDAGPWGAFWQSVGDGTFSLGEFSDILQSVPKDRDQIQGFLRALSEKPVPTEARTVAYVYLLLQAGSFGGKALWTDGGKWRNNTFRSFWRPTATSNRRSTVNPMMPMPDAMAERIAVLLAARERVVGVWGDVRSVPLAPDSVVYIDPPYEDTTAYGHGFDVASYARLVAQCGRRVYVAEGRALSEKAFKIADGRAKGGISGERAKTHEEWLSEFGTEVVPVGGS
jgi:site-specific DNA-adenine methylase